MQSFSKTLNAIATLIFFVLISSSFVAPAQNNAAYTFDDFKLGDNYGNIMSRPAYSEPCDNDPIDSSARRFMVYGGLPCREHSFPMQTTVVFYIKYSKTDKYNQPIEAFGFLGGNYFDDKTNFPVKPGDALKKAKKKFGKQLEEFNIERKQLALTVVKFRNNIYVICDQQRIVGFVIGEMPSNPANEQWRGLMQMYDRYTPKI